MANALLRERDRVAPRVGPSDASVRPLLLELLARMRRFSDTPLRQGMDGIGVAFGSWSAFANSTPAEQLAALGDWPWLLATLDRLVWRALQGTTRGAAGPVPSSPEAESGESDTHETCHEVAPPAPQGRSVVGQSLDPLIAWVERSDAAIRAVSSLGIEVIASRLEGAGDREIAERLGLGLRLVHRVARDLRPAWAELMEK